MIQHHPSPEILVDYARGALSGGLALVVACHCAGCGVCRDEVGLWEAVGGVMLEGAEAEPVAENALADTLARIGDRGVEASACPPNFLLEYALPTPLLRQKVGARRWITPNIWFAPVETSPLTYLVFGRRGTMLPFHTHGGREFTHVLEGAFDDIAGHFEVGDFEETDGHVEHAPTATADRSCLCLISSETPMQFKYRTARVIQSFFGKRY